MANVAQVAVGTAVVAGTAGVVHHHQQKKWANQQAQQQSQYDQAYQQGIMDAQAPQQQYAPPPQYAAPVQPAPAQDDLAAKIEHLGQLHTAGVLTDAEFAAAKEKLLAG